MTRPILAVALAGTLLGCESNSPTTGGKRDPLHEQEIYAVLKEQPVPQPKDTPYDADVRRREVYLQAFRAGYEYAISGRALHTFMPSAAGLPQDMHGVWNAGCNAGSKAGSDRWLAEYQSLVKPGGQPGRAADGSQPFGSVSKQTSGAAGSPR
jgi:hypothetical protein